MSSYTSWKNYHLILKLFNLYHTPPKRMFSQYFSNFLIFSVFDEISRILFNDRIFSTDRIFYGTEKFFLNYDFRQKSEIFSRHLDQN